MRKDEIDECSRVVDKVEAKLRELYIAASDCLVYVDISTLHAHRTGLEWREVSRYIHKRGFLTV